ncbi:MAG: hypothetical protein PUK05_02085 [Peptoniphilaceae bacterium]|nr:hypothetical protein [Peptoniphilaceae bacterium]MDY5765627.1 hypothetical protein [Peptoniphilaceae bacterium]
MKNKILQKGTWLLFIIFLLLGFAIGFFTKAQLVKKDQENREEIAQKEPVHLPAQSLIENVEIETVHMDTKKNTIRVTFSYKPFEEIAQMVSRTKIRTEYPANLSGFIFRQEDPSEQFSITPVTENATLDFAQPGSLFLEFKNENEEIPLNEVYGVGVEFLFEPGEELPFSYVCGYTMNPEGGLGTIE